LQKSYAINISEFLFCFTKVLPNCVLTEVSSAKTLRCQSNLQIANLLRKFQQYVSEQSDKSLCSHSEHYDNKQVFSLLTPARNVIIIINKGNHDAAYVYSNN